MGLVCIPFNSKCLTSSNLVKGASELIVKGKASQDVSTCGSFLGRLKNLVDEKNEYSFSKFLSLISVNFFNYCN